MPGVRGFLVLDRIIQFEEESRKGEPFATGQLHSVFADFFKSPNHTVNNVSNAKFVHLIFVTAQITA